MLETLADLRRWFARVTAALCVFLPRAALHGLGHGEGGGFGTLGWDRGKFGGVRVVRTTLLVRDVRLTCGLQGDNFSV